MMTTPRLVSIKNGDIVIQDREGIVRSVDGNQSYMCQSSMLMVFFGLQRLAVLISSGRKGWLLYRQTTTGGLTLFGEYYATIPAAITVLLQETQL